MSKPEYNIPAGYFEQKNAQLKQIPQQERGIIKFPRWQNALAIAASISLLIAAGLYYTHYNTTKNAGLNQVSASALNEFISYSPYSAYPETYLFEEQSLELEEVSSEQLFNEEQLDRYLNQYDNEFL